MTSRLFGVSLESFKATFDLERSRIGSVDGLRALAILMVFNVHFFGFYSAQNYFLANDSLLSRVIGILRAGHLGVDLFFVISGYLIYLSIRGKRQGFSFFKKRALRLLPVHVLVCLYVATGTTGISIGIVALNASFLAPLFGVPLLNDVTWSLTWEWLFYLFIFAAAALNFKNEIWLIVTVALLAASFPYLAREVIGWPVFFQPERFIGFLFGVALVLFQRFKESIVQSAVWQAAVGTSFLGILILQIIWSLWSGRIVTYPFQAGFYIIAGIFFTVILQACLQEGSKVQRFFAHTLLRFIGKISYSFYIIHAIVIGTFLNRFSPADSIGMVFFYYAVVLCAVIILASGLYYLLEKPYFNRAVEG